MSELEIRPVAPEDRPWVKEFSVGRWGAEIIVVHGTVHRPHELPGFLAMLRGQDARDDKIGLLTYEIRDGACEIVTLDSIQPGIGVGSALVQAVNTAARQSGCRRVWLVTTNDNLHALGFYQRRGFAIVAVYPEAVEHARRLKPHIPRVGQRGIPIRDELELEMIV